jgi:hypothetical protein
MVIKNSGLGENLKILNRMKKLKVEDISEKSVFASYYYSNELGVFNMKSSKVK